MPGTSKDAWGPGLVGQSAIDRHPQTHIKKEEEDDLKETTLSDKSK